jgi:hypothetical protein
MRARGGRRRASAGARTRPPGRSQQLSGDDRIRLATGLRPASASATFHDVTEGDLNATAALASAVGCRCRPGDRSQTRGAVPREAPVLPRLSGWGRARRVDRRRHRGSCAPGGHVAFGSGVGRLTSLRQSRPAFFRRVASRAGAAGNEAIDARSHEPARANYSVRSHKRPK